MKRLALLLALATAGCGLHPLYEGGASGPVDDVLTQDNLAIAYGGRLAKALAAVR